MKFLRQTATIVLLTQFFAQTFPAQRLRPTETTRVLSVVMQATQPGHERLVTWEPATLVNGAPCVFRVRLPASLRSLRGTWLGKTVYFHFDRSSDNWIGFAGIDLDTEPGEHPLALEAVSAAGGRTVYTANVTVAKGSYSVTALRVPKRYTDPDQETLRRILHERDLKNELLNVLTADRMWQGRFAAPTSTTTTGVYGSQRTFNGVRQSVHQGLDFRAATGTPVRAINSGRVILARDFFFEGNFLVIDHGQGLLSLYLHLSDFKVKEGEIVRKGQLVALSGGTGRATGPHLHLGVRWQGVYVNPAILLKLSLPE